MSANITLTKYRSPHVVRITPDKEDTHFTVVELVRIKTGIVVCSHLILTSDVQQWQSMYEKDGYKNNSNE